MKSLVASFLVLLSLTSCGGHSIRQQEVGDTLRLKYASLLTIVQHDGYTVAEIRNPWKEGRLLHTYLLVPQGKEVPQGAPHGTVIHTPVRRAAVFTTVHCAMLNTIGHGYDIVAVADLKYIKIPFIHERVKTGLVADCGNGLSPMVEKILDIKPDIVMLSPFENSGGYGKLEDIDIPLVECAEYMETSPLARAEWMKFYGMLFGEDVRTDSLFAIVDSSYNALRRKAAEAGRGRSLLIDKMVGSVWYVPGGRSTIGCMVQDAGACYPWADDEQSGSLALPFETVLERGGDSDAWLYRYSSNHTEDYRELLSQHHGYSQLRPYREKQVYGCNVEQSLFYEETPFRPDYLLSDFIQIAHPDLPTNTEVMSLPPLRYFKKLNE